MSGGQHQSVRLHKVMWDGQGYVSRTLIRAGCDKTGTEAEDGIDKAVVRLASTHKSVGFDEIGFDVRRNLHSRVGNSKNSWK